MNIYEYRHINIYKYMYNENLKGRSKLVAAKPQAPS